MAPPIPPTWVNGPQQPQALRAPLLRLPSNLHPAPRLVTAPKQRGHQPREQALPIRCCPLLLPMRHTVAYQRRRPLAVGGQPRVEVLQGGTPHEQRVVFEEVDHVGELLLLAERPSGTGEQAVDCGCSTDVLGERWHVRQLAAQEGPVMGVAVVR